jgi:retron-type reverse transcriptase
MKEVPQEKKKTALINIFLQEPESYNFRREYKENIDRYPKTNKVMKWKQIKIHIYEQFTTHLKGRNAATCQKNLKKNNSLTNQSTVPT